MLLCTENYRSYFHAPEGFFMGKLAVKTALITFASVIVAAAVFIGVCFAFFPGATSDSAYSLGLYDLSVSMAERQYNSDKTSGSLKKLTERAIFSDNYEAVFKYAKIFLDSEDFKEIAEKQDEKDGLTATDTDKYAGFVASGYAECLFKRGDETVAVRAAEEYSRKYGAVSSYSFLVIEAYDSKNGELASSIISSIEKENDWKESESLLAGKYKKTLKSLING